MKQPHVWVVEMWNAERQRWEPCADCSIARHYAREALRDWSRRNPFDIFRIAKYVCVSAGRK